MAVAVRLSRFGKKGKPAYKIVVAHQRSKRDGKYIEAIGLYDPMVEPFKLEINKERFDYWLSKGAVVSEGLRRLLKNRKLK